MKHCFCSIEEDFDFSDLFFRSFVPFILVILMEASDIVYNDAMLFPDYECKSNDISLDLVSFI